MLNISTFYPSLSDYIAYDILLQYLNELLSQARVQAGSKNFPEEQMKMLRRTSLKPPASWKDCRLRWM